jgi:trehalose 6-phosphate synthase/phosphatase
MLVPAAIRRRLPDARIGFFLHVPFPPPEIFRAFPSRDEIVSGLMAADLIGFHTEEYAANFRATVTALTATEYLSDTPAGTHTAEIGVFPLGVDAHEWERLADDPHVHELTARFKAEAQGRKILVAVDRLDYTKGILSRLAAIEDLFTKGILTPDSAVLYQVTVPTRQALSSYETVKSRAEEMVGRINSLYGGLNVTPIKSSYGTLSPKELCALYRAANVMLITPLRDGMNLVSKEFVASRPDLDAVLVLSEFSGAADELTEALKVNPYDVAGMGKTIHEALEMTAVERRYRMERLRERVLGATAEQWAASFADRLRAYDSAPVLV